MGGKGQRRRVKNYKAAHGGNSRLPPPPNARDLEALPSKLRLIMELRNPASATPGSLQGAREAGRERKKSTAGQRKANPKDVHSFPDSEFKLGDKNEEARSMEHNKDKDAIPNMDSHDKRKGKKKRMAINDLRFQDLDADAAHLRKRKRKKEFFEARKNKRKKAKTDAAQDFPGHEEIKFGEVVEAPPKLSFPKALKTARDASHERLRLQMVESYRNHKGWASRPGMHRPPITETLST